MIVPMIRAFLPLLLLLQVCAGAVAAQTSAAPTLLADQITYIRSQDALEARGNVTIVQGDRVVRAERILYRNATGEVIAFGPITLQTAEQGQITADYAELAPDLQRGVIQGARLVLAENFQFAAVEARRLDGQTTTLYKTVASSCQVCADQPIPLWLIRADRVLRDEAEQQIHFEGARFEALGVTLAYLPYFRMADPSVDRASGFLNPEFRRSDIYGFGLRLPYFHVIDAHSDATITPFLTTSGAAILEAEYRRRFGNGGLDMTGSVALYDEDGRAAKRGHLFVEADFALPRDIGLTLDLAAVTDKTYLATYGYSEADRLQSEIRLQYQSPNRYSAASLIGYQTLRDTERDVELPFVLPELVHAQHWDDVAGGRATLEAGGFGLIRRDGRDVLKAEIGAAWSRRGILGPGIVGRGFVGARATGYVIGDDPAFGDSAARIVPLAGAELRWPLARSRGSATHVIEPVAQIITSRIHGDDSIPNEDSQAVEFDAANLFALNRYPGSDRLETGTRLNMGASYTRIDASGWQLGFTIGQVYRSETQEGFPANTGLNGVTSNIVAAANLDLPPWFTVSNQTLFNQSLEFSRNDIQAALTLDRFDLDASYVYLATDRTGGTMTPQRHELALATRYRFADNWAVDAALRRDLADGRNVYAEAGLEFGNECLRTRFSASRRFANSGSLPPSTEFGLSVSLAGFGTDSEWPAHSCVQYDGPD